MAKTTPDAPQPTKSFSPTIVKWIVLGVVVISFMVLFKAEIGRLLDRTTDLDISATSVRIKTVSTPLGEAEVSVIPTSATGLPSEGIHGTTFTSQKYKFQISWPESINWSASETMGPALLEQMGAPPTIEIPITIVKKDLVGTFRPNINVVVEQVSGSISIEEYMDLSIKNLQQSGWEVISSTIDDDTQAGFITMISHMYGNDIFQFQRLVVAGNRAYVVTASQLPPDNMISQQLRQELLKIMNSFRLLS